MDDEEFLKDFDNQLSEHTEEGPAEDVVEEDEDTLPEDPQLEEEDIEVDSDEDPQEDPEIADTGSEEEPEELGDEDPADSVDYEEFYASIMKPFKANGKEIEIKNPNEAVQLMQMGANYTRKMQEISKHRKTLATLEEHGIQDIEDVRFLIDLKNKNPEAIKKFFKDNELDPFDIDTSDEVNYKPSARVVSDSDVEAREVLTELNSTPEGAQTLSYIADNWDDESTAFMWSNPSAFNIIHEQRESGVFDKIMSEVERQTTLGILPHGGSILEKYHTVGNQLYGGQPQQDVNTRRPIDTRVASRSSAQRSSRRAQAASSPRASKRTSMVLDDMLNLDDDAFLQAMKNKL